MSKYAKIRYQNGEPKLCTHCCFYKDSTCNAVPEVKNENGVVQCHNHYYKELMTDFYDEQFQKIFWPDAFGKAYNKEIDDNLVDDNPKTAAARGKMKMSDVPPVALFALGAAMSDGASKYGRFNYRDTSVTPSIFYDAIMRHLTSWYNGEDFAEDSKVHHLAHIMAGCAIILDATVHNKLNDDRDKRKPEPVKKEFFKKGD